MLPSLMIRSLLRSGSLDKTLEFFSNSRVCTSGSESCWMDSFSSLLLSLGTLWGDAHAGRVAVLASCPCEKVFCANGGLCICFPVAGHLGCFSLCLLKIARTVPILAQSPVYKFL